MPAANKRYPVLQRYIDQISTRVLSFGGDPATVPSSPEGYTAPSSSSYKWWSGLSILLLVALMASLGALTGAWLTIVPPILAVLTLIAESVLGRPLPSSRLRLALERFHRRSTGGLATGTVHTFRDLGSANRTGSVRRCCPVGDRADDRVLKQMSLEGNTCGFKRATCMRSDYRPVSSWRTRVECFV